ncbi:hypothetical protein PFISCL1PPCAC_349, partial [Pristionchus fissidentatus]
IRKTHPSFRSYTTGMQYRPFFSKIGDPASYSKINVNLVKTPLGYSIEPENTSVQEVKAGKIKLEKALEVFIFVFRIAVQALIYGFMITVIVSMITAHQNKIHLEQSQHAAEQQLLLLQHQQQGLEDSEDANDPEIEAKLKRHYEEIFAHEKLKGTQDFKGKVYVPLWDGVSLFDAVVARQDLHEFVTMLEQKETITNRKSAQKKNRRGGVRFDWKRLLQSYPDRTDSAPSQENPPQPVSSEPKS